jgi:hypothetical protein
MDDSSHRATPSEYHAMGPRAGRRAIKRILFSDTALPPEPAVGPVVETRRNTKHQTRNTKLELEAQFDEESLGGFEVIDNDEDVVHPFKRHILPFLASLLMPGLAARGG